MSRFRIEITDEMCLSHPVDQWARMTAYIDRLDPLGRHLVGYQFDRNSWRYEGEGPQELVTVLQAAARGDDLKTVLDLLEETRGTG